MGAVEVEMGAETEGAEVEEEGHHLEVLRLLVLFRWKRGDWRGHYGMSDLERSRASEPWPLK